MSKKLALAGLIAVSQVHAALPVNPWPHDNPYGVPSAAVATGQTAPAQSAPMPQAMPAQTAPTGSSGQQMDPMQILQSMMGDRLANGGPGGNPGGYNPRPGTGSALEMGGPAGTGPGGVNLQSVNACSAQPGKFNFKFGHYPAAGCDGQIKMHEDMSNFISNTMGRCVSQAAGINSFERGKIYHAGTMGDANHQRTGSLHNYGLAIDINTIEVDGKVFTYKDKGSASKEFFRKLRQCWSEAAQRERNGCLPQRSSGMPHGSIGDEDHRHHNHLHLSLPMCRNVAGGAYMAWWFDLLWSAAHAEEKLSQANERELLPPPSKFERKKIKFPKGEAEIIVEDTGGEPIGADHLITLSAKCDNGKPAAAPFAKIEACEFIEARYNKKAKAIEAIFRTSRMKDGRVTCDKSQIAQAKVKCD